MLLLDEMTSSPPSSPRPSAAEASDKMASKSQDSPKALAKATSSIPSSPHLSSTEAPQAPVTPPAHATKSELFESPAQSSEHSLAIRKRPREDDGSPLHQKIKALRQTSDSWDAHAANVAEGPNERIDAQQMSLNALLEMKTAEIELVNEQFRNGEIDEDQKQQRIFKLLHERHHVSHSSTLIESSRHHLIDEELEHRAQNPGVSNFLEESITTLLEHTMHRAKDSFKKNKINVEGTHVPFRDILIDRYSGTKEVEGIRLWCPILGRFLAPSNVTAAHIVPRLFHKKPALIQKIFSINTDHIEGFLMSGRNGLMMAGTLEKKFDLGWFIIVPTEAFGVGEIPEFRVHVLRKRVLDLAAFTFDDGKTLLFRDLHGKHLKFPDDCSRRPGRRCLFFRMICSILMAKAEGEQDWKSQIISLAENSKQWMSPGRYLVSSIITRLWHMVLQTEIPAFIAEGLFDGELSTMEARSRVMDLMATLDTDALRRKGEIPDEDDSGDEFAV
jgi:hypothetical protein